MTELNFATGSLYQNISVAYGDCGISYLQIINFIEHVWLVNSAIVMGKHYMELGFCSC